MKCLLLLFVVPTVLAQVGFGRSYLKNSRLCRQWSCLNQKLGLQDDLPSKDQFSTVFKALLPQGPWQEVADKVLDVCYGDRPKMYTNTCPGQALLHCITDQMVDNCIEDSWRKDDACSYVFSIAGVKYMFSQSVYEDMEKNLPKERRPVWFMQNYFDSKCCNLPEMFNSTVLRECGFNGFMTYYTHVPRYNTQSIAERFQENFKVTTRPVENNGDSVKIGDLPQFLAPDENFKVTTRPVENNGDSVKIVDLAQFLAPDESKDPLDCCAMNDFIQPSWREECGFHLNWKGQDRLVILNGSAPVTTEAPTTTITPRPEIKDLVMVPESCEKENCVFKKLGVVSEFNLVNKDAYLKILDNFTDSHPSWTHAKARVVTKCLSRHRLTEYEHDCEINRILACTFDVLTENCPYARKSDVCRSRKDASGCQISSSKYRPKNRRSVCLLPELVNKEFLNGCGLDSVRRVDHITVEMPRQRKIGWMSSKYVCQDTTPSTTCLMRKMGILNKYNFMDYFQMKDRIRRFTSQSEWAALKDVYLSAFNNIPMYREHCSSAKKFLNVVDSMLMTCPVSKRKNTTHCTQLFEDIIHTSPINERTTKHKQDEILKHFQQIYISNPNQISHSSRGIRHRRPKITKKPLYNYGVFNTGTAPEVKTLDIKPATTELPKVNETLIILPVYLRPNKLQAHPNDGVFRGNPFFRTTVAMSMTTDTSLPKITPRKSNVEFMKP